MAQKQIHELASATSPRPEDRLLVSTATGNLSRRLTIAELPVRVAGGSTIRRIGERLAEFVSVTDFGAAGNGSTDDAAAFQAALDAAERVFVPPGVFRIDSPISIKPRRRLVGAGRDITVIDARGALAFTFQRNAGAHVVDPLASQDWNRSGIEDLTIRMAVGGLDVNGHEFFASRLQFAGGLGTGWCISMLDANECGLREISGGYGGGGNVLRANGIRWRGTTPGVNYGDSTLTEISLKLGAANLTGVRLEHVGDATSLINNMNLGRIQVNAPHTGAQPWSGTVGVSLRQVRRCLLQQVDVEAVEVGFEEIGAAASGNAGSNLLVSYVGCHVLNCPTGYRDNNGTVAGSSMRRTFLGTTDVFPLRTGIASSDAAAQAGQGDTLLPAGLWLSEPNQGGVAVQVRAPATGQLLVTGDFHDGVSAVRDGNPKNASPRQGFGVDIASANVTRLYRPRGYALDQESRLALGNGEGHANGPLHRVEIADPLFLPARSAEPPQPRDGLIVHVADRAVLPSDAAWIGAGWYTRLDGRWQPGTSPIGRLADRERNNDFTVSPMDFGTVHRVNNASDRRVVIASTYQLGGNTFPLMQSGDADAVFWIVRQGTGTVTIEVGDPGVVVLTAGGNDASVKIKRQYQVVQVILRFNGSSNRIEAYTTAVPDFEFLWEEPVGWTSASAATNSDMAPYLVNASRMGQLLRISSSANPAYVAFDTASLPANVQAATMRIVTVANPIRLLAKSNGGLILRRINMQSQPGDLPCFEVTELGRVLTVHLTTNDDPNQARSIYIEG